MNSYTASNGVGLTITRDRAVRWRPGIPPDLVSSALREYFQAERDEELGRWRDPENPNMVCYPRPALDNLHGRRVWLLDEHSGEVWLDWEHTASPGPARRYFDAHPGEDPHKPWHDAKAGEYWAVTVNGERKLAYGGPQGLYSVEDWMVFPNSDITAGRRIWPEGEASE